MKKEVSLQSKLALSFLSFLSLGFLFLAIYLFKGFSDYKGIVLALAGLGLLFEFFAVEVPFFGTASVTVVICFIISFLIGAPAGIIICFFLAAFRLLILNKRPFVLGLAEFCITVISFAIVALLYDILSPKIMKGYEVILVVLAAFAMHTIDVIFSLTITPFFLSVDNYKDYSQIKNRISILYLAFLPLAFIFAQIFAEFKYWAILLFIPIGFVLLSSMKDRILEKIVGKQELLKNQITDLSIQLEKTQKDKVNLESAVGRKVDELAIFFEMGQALITSAELESVLGIVLSFIKRLFYFQSCAIFLIDENNKPKAAKYQSPYKEALEMSELLKVEEITVKTVHNNKKPLWVPDMQQAGKVKRIFKDEFSVLCVPLIVQDNIIGVIYVGQVQANSYNEQDLSTLSLLGNASALSINSALLFEKQKLVLQQQKVINVDLDKKVKQLAGLFELSKELGSSFKMQDVLNLIVDKLHLLLPFQTCAIFLLKDYGDHKIFNTAKSVTPYGDYFKNLTFKFDEPDHAIGWVTQHKKALILDDTKTSVLGNILAAERSVILAPLFAENEVFGILYLGAAQENTYSAEYMSIVSTASFLIAIAIKNAQLYDKTVSQAITDGVTGLYNHRYFQERLVESINWAERYKMKFALVMIDVDKFKQYNDTLGHPEGDKVLVEIANILKSYTRSTDVVCRYGGDEFSILILEVEPKDAYAIVERIWRAFHYRFNDRAVKLTASIGISYYPDDATTKTELMKIADELVYLSKKSGRNKISLAGELVGQNIDTSIPIARG